MRPRSGRPCRGRRRRGSYQSATKMLPSGATQTSLGRNQLSRAREQHFLVQFVARALRLAVERTAPRAGRRRVCSSCPRYFFGQQRAFVEADAGRAAEAGAQHLVDDAGLLLVPVALARAARAVAVVAAGHHEADARLLVAVVVVVREPDFAEASRRSTRSCCGSCGRSVRGSCRPGRSARRCPPGNRCCSTCPLAALAVAAIAGRRRPASPTVK